MGKYICSEEKKKKKVQLNVHIKQDFIPNSLLYIGLKFEFEYDEYRNRNYVKNFKLDKST